VGFGAGSTATNRAAMARARDTGKVVATARITLLSTGDRALGFAAFAPV